MQLDHPSSLFLGSAWRLEDAVLFPASAAFELVTSVQRVLRDPSQASCAMGVRGVVLVRPVVLDGAGAHIEVRVDSSRGSIELGVQRGASPWSPCIQCWVQQVACESESSPAPASGAYLDATRRGRTCVPQDSAHLYGSFARAGYRYGRSFQRMSGAHVSADASEALARILPGEVCSSRGGDDSTFWVHPAMLDSTMQLGIVMASASASSGEGTFIPASVDALTSCSPCGSGAAFGSSLCFRESDARGRPQGVECHRLVRGDTGADVAIVERLVSKGISVASIRAPAAAESAAGDLVYDVQWYCSSV
ncbi:MAG: polyketide synthase dehydratase domain-containing protein, partial [Myxococcota bacterium]|nr:polyketide synthase dehydratase domain-containing protein [Myxococcota bacterium]